jgi:hypothetical protein
MHRQTGFSVLTLMILAIALLTGLAFLLIGSGPNVQGQLNTQRSAELIAQAQLIAHRLTQCTTDYPQGDNGTAFHKAYPRDTNPGARAVADLICPGSNQNLWSGVDGVYLPQAPSGFNAWQYTNTATASISITSTAANTYASAIANAASKIGNAASATPSTLTVKIIE